MGEPVRRASLRQIVPSKASGLFLSSQQPRYHKASWKQGAFFIVDNFIFFGEKIYRIMQDHAESDNIMQKHAIIDRNMQCDNLTVYYFMILSKQKKTGQVKWYHFSSGHFTSCPLTCRGWLAYSLRSTLKAGDKKTWRKMRKSPDARNKSKPM